MTVRSKIIMKERKKKEELTLWYLTTSQTAAFGVLTSIYTLGGLCGSLLAGRIADTRGRRAAVVWAAWAVLLGTALMFIGQSLTFLVLGRCVSNHQDNVAK
jgi:MFS family permease